MPTNDEHLAELEKLATMYEKSARYFNAPALTSIGKLHARRAEAIRWILNLTAYPIEEHTAE
jgi:hypothetical protein